MKGQRKISLDSRMTTGQPGRDTLPCGSHSPQLEVIVEFRDEDSNSLRYIKKFKVTEKKKRRVPRSLLTLLAKMEVRRGTGLGPDLGHEHRWSLAAASPRPASDLLP